MFQFLSTNPNLPNYVVQLIELGKSLKEFKKNFFRYGQYKMNNTMTNNQERVIDVSYVDSKDTQQSVIEKRRKLKVSSTTSSRQYKCPCEKQYYSYAAAYTHVKNKHGGSKQYLSAIIRPNFSKTKKGRPRKFNQIVVNDQYSKLHLIDCCIDQIFQKIQRFTKDRLILQPKEQFESSKVTQQYKKLESQKIVPLVNILETQQDSSEPFFGELKDFYNELTKQFTPKVSSKILATINYMYQQNVQKHQQMFQLQLSKMILKQNMQNVWYNNQNAMQLYELINQKFNQWVQCSKAESGRKEQQDKEEKKVIYQNSRPKLQE